MNTFLLFLKQHRLSIVGALLGALGGYLYYRYVGCESGSCPITASPYLSLVWGALLGSLLLGLFKKNAK